MVALKRLLPRRSPVGAWVALGLWVAAPWPALGAAQSGTEHVTLIWEGENFTACYPGLKAVDAKGASGGRGVRGPSGLRMRGARVVYCVRVPRSATYYLWARMQAGSGEWGTLGTVRADGQDVGRIDYPWFSLHKSAAASKGEPVEWVEVERGVLLCPWRWTPCLSAKLPRSGPAKGTRVQPAPLELTQGVHVLEIGPFGGSPDLHPDQLDMLLLTTDADRDLSPVGELLPVAGERVVVPQTEPDDLVAIEAERASTLELPCEPRAAAGASEGRALGWRDDDWGGSATYALPCRFPGTYYLWARMSLASRWDWQPGRSGCWTAATEGARSTLTLWPEAATGWTWVRTWHRNDGGGPERLIPLGFEFPAGIVSLTLQPGKPHVGVRLLVDQVLLTRDPYYVPARLGYDQVEVTRPQD